MEELGITDEAAVKSITDTYSADIKAEQEAVTTIKTQLDEANKTIKSYKDMDVDSIKKSADDWQQKYEQLEAQQKEKEYSDKLDKFIKDQGMKNSVYAEYLKDKITAQNLQFDDKGILTGGDAVVKALRESCPDAFAADPTERAAAPTSGRVPQAMSGVEARFYEMNPGLRK